MEAALDVAAAGPRLVREPDEIRRGVVVAR